MSDIILPNIPEVHGGVMATDPQLRELLIAIKLTLEKITGATPEEFTDLLEKNE